LRSTRHPDIDEQIQRYLEKYTNSIEIISEFLDTSKSCPNQCYDKLKDIVQRHEMLDDNDDAHQNGGPPLEEASVEIGVDRSYAYKKNETNS
jgi:hypothetical protein